MTPGHEANRPGSAPHDSLRILFVGHAESSHTHSWIDLLANSGIDVRLFALPTGVPPPGWAVYTYVTAPLQTNSAHRCVCDSGHSLHYWLATTIAEWRPHIVHTLGLEPAGRFYFDVANTYLLHPFVTWVLQLRGGSDLALAQFDEESFPKTEAILRAADQIITDNAVNVEIARRSGIAVDRVFGAGLVPGTGGIEVDALLQRWKGMPSERRAIVWPKAYNVTWSAALPVLEAIRLCWKDIQPCQIHMLAMSTDVRAWYRTLPGDIRASCHISDRIPREQALDLMSQARVMLAPSLVDGTPNAMFEAMASGAVPIVSPLDSISAIVSHRQNVLFARNLYPAEIAEALTLAMNDGDLVDRIARNNISRVRELADRDVIRVRMIQYYRDLQARKTPNTWSSQLQIIHDSGVVFDAFADLNLPTRYANLQADYQRVAGELARVQGMVDAVSASTIAVPYEGRAISFRSWLQNASRTALRRGAPHNWRRGSRHHR